MKGQSPISRSPIADRRSVVLSRRNVTRSERRVNVLNRRVTGQSYLRRKPRRITDFRHVDRDH